MLDKKLLLSQLESIGDLKKRVRKVMTLEKGYAWIIPDRDSYPDSEFGGQEAEEGPSSANLHWE